MTRACAGAAPRLRLRGRRSVLVRGGRWAVAALGVTWLAACGRGPDVVAPVLEAPGFGDGAVVHDATITVPLRARDDRGVASVAYLTDRGAAGDCARGPSDEYACGPIPLAVGENAVLVRARDAAGNAASLVLSFVRVALDGDPPDLRVFGVDDGAVVATETIALTAVATDANGVAEVAFATDHGASGACGPPSGEAWPCGPIPLPLGDTVVTVTAKDVVGNQAAVAVAVRREPPDTAPPNLEVTGLADGATVTVSAIVLVATATDDRGVASVRFATDQGAAGACGPPAGDAWSCGPIPLPLGDTLVTVTATDAAGNAASDERRVRRVPVSPGSGFDIEFVFFSHLFLPAQLAAFEAAAARWEALVVRDLEDFAVDLAAGASCGMGEPAYAGTIDDVVVFVTSFTEGAGGLLGYAGPCRLRGAGADAGLPAVGVMALDILDLPALEAEGALVATIVHELGHVLGFGTLWETVPYHDLLDYVAADGAPDCRSATAYHVRPTFVGPAGVAAWQALGGTGAVPVEDAGGAGTRCGHWDEATFGTELMTGYLQVGATNPLSALTVRSLQDLGYGVDATAADPYALPSVLGSAAAGGVDLAGREVLLRPLGTLEPGAAKP